MAQQISAFPPVPLLTDTPEVFDPKAVTWNLFQANTLQPELNALATEAETNAGTAETKAAESLASAALSEDWATSLTVVSGGLKGARGYAQDAETFANSISGAVNFKGAWSNLTGPLDVPATVFHNDGYWQLLNNLVDVTTSEPGVSADWANASANVTKGTLTQSFLANQLETVALASEVDGAAVVSVTKEVPQTGITNDTWAVQLSGANYDVEDAAYATTLTPSATTGNITLTLGAGAFTASDVGKTITGNGGVAVLTNADGSATVTTAFNDTSAIASGDWSMRAAVFDGGSVELSSFIAGFSLTGASYDNVIFSVAGQDSVPLDISFNPAGTKMFVVGTSGDSIYQYTLTTGFDLRTASYDSVSFSVAGQDSNPRSVFFNPAGTKMFVVGLVGQSIYQYTLTTGFDLGTASYDSVSFSVAGQDSSPAGIEFNIDGTKMFIVAQANDTVYQYTLTTGFDLSTASYSSVSFSVAGQETSPVDFYFNPDGTKMFILGGSGSIYQYTLTTGFDLSTASYDGVSFSVAGQETQPSGLAFNTGGTKMFILGINAPASAYQYTTGENFAVTPQHIPAITNAAGQIDSTFWTDINSAFATDTPNSQTINYAFSTDGRATFQVVRENEGARNIVRDSAGTWEVNTNVTYNAETWVAAAENSVWGALSEAMNIAANTMNATALASATDADFPATGDTLDLAIILFTNNATQIPSSQGVTLNYDANVLNQGAINGTDYEWDQPNNSTVRIKALTANNLKVRIA